MKSIRIFVSILLLLFLHTSDGDGDAFDVSTEPYNSTKIREMLRQGKVSDVLSTLHALPPDLQTSVDVRINMARAYLQQGNAAQAEKILVQTVNDFPDSIEALISISKLLMHLQRWPEVQKYLSQALEVQKDNHEVILLLGKLFYIRDKDGDKARRYLERARDLRPDDENVHFELGMILFSVGEHDQGRQCFQEAERLNPAMDRKVLGKIYLHYKQYECALEEFEKHLQVSQSRGGLKPDVESMLLLAECNDLLGNPQSALNIHREILELEPNNALSHAAIGLLLLGTSSRNFAAVNACGLNHEEALLHLRRAQAIDPNLKQVTDAINFCKLEFTEVLQWRQSLGDEYRDRFGDRDEDQDSDEEERNGNMELSSATPLSVTVSAMKAIRGILDYPFFVIPKVFEELRLAFIMPMLCMLNVCPRGQETIAPPPESGIEGGGVRQWLCNKQRNKINVKAFHSSSASVPANKTAEMIENWSKRSQSMPSVERTTITSADEFLNQYVLQNKPVIITNFQEGWASSDAFTRKALHERFGDKLVRVSVSETGRFDGPENGTLWGLGPNVDVLVRPPQTTMFLTDFLILSDIDSSSSSSSSLSDSKNEESRNSQSKNNKEENNIANKETFYLEYLSLYQYLGQPFLDMIPMPAVANTSALTHLVTNLWIGHKPTISPLHYDDYENLLCQIQGRKELTLYPPTDVSYLYYVGRPKGVLKYEFPGGFIRDKDSVDSRSFVFGSSVHVDEPDESRHPLFKRAHPLHAILEKGDVLYLPAFWHHEVQSIPDYNEGLNVAVNFWFANMTQSVEGMM